MITMYDDEMAVNRRWWDGATPVHYRSRSYNVDGFRQGGTSLLPLELGELGDVSGRRLLHLQCHFGLDTLSWARRGAEVTGVDFSPQAIATARRLAQELSIPARFIESNIYTLPEVHHERYDIVYTGYGALCWLPDLDRWAKVVARSLRPGGVFYVLDSHPIMDMIDYDVPDRVELKLRYFTDGEPEMEDSPNTYTDSDRPLEERVTYSWSHPLSEIVGSLLSAGLQLDFLHESELGYFNAHPLMRKRDDGHWTFPPGTCRLPLTFSLMAHLPDHDQTVSSSR
jgi:SAM-dependent methyltransferase